MTTRYDAETRKAKEQEFLSFEKFADGLREGSKTHPNFVESVIPVYGSAREAIADYQEGDISGAVLNGALALTDLVPVGAASKALAKGTAFYVAKKSAKDAAAKEGAYAWPKVRRWMGHTKTGQLEKGEHGHHWAIPREAAWAPDWLKNQPWNIKGLDAVTHGRVHGPYTVTDSVGQRTKLPQFGLPEQIWHGTPAWAKAVGASAPGRLAGTVKAGIEDDD